ncbi:interleukin-8-like [Mustelus asterias]
MNSKVTVIVITFFVLYMSSIQTTTPMRIMPQPRCKCTFNMSRFINPQKMKDIDVFPMTPHCPHVEVIATLKVGTKICLNPEAQWVKKLLERILEQN